MTLDAPNQLRQRRGSVYSIFSAEGFNLPSPTIYPKYSRVVLPISHFVDRGVKFALPSLFSTCSNIVQFCSHVVACTRISSRNIETQGIKIGKFPRILCKGQLPVSFVSSIFEKYMLWLSLQNMDSESHIGSVSSLNLKTNLNKADDSVFLGHN